MAWNDVSTQTHTFCYKKRDEMYDHPQNSATQDDDEEDANDQQQKKPACSQRKKLNISI